MAANLLDHIDDEFLSCAICMGRFKSPKTLPCLHTFCEGCLGSYINKNEEVSMRGVLPCPNCREEVRIGENGVASLQGNFFVTSLCEIFDVRDRRGGTDIVCADCNGALTGSCSFCTHCSDFLCSPCGAQHTRIKLTKDHRVMPFSEMESVDRLLEKRSRFPTTCKKHAQETLKLYCEVCEIPLCMLCSVTDHKGHAVTAVEEAATKVRANIVRTLEQAENKVSAYHDLLDKAKQTKTNLESARPKAKECIDAQAKRLIDSFAEQVHMHAENLKIQVDERFSLKQQHIDKYKLKIENDVEGARNACDYSRKVMRYGNVVEVLTSKNTLTKKLTDVHRAKLEPVGTKGMMMFAPTRNQPVMLQESDVGRVFWLMGGEDLHNSVQKYDKVERSNDWIWEEQDGGPGKKGTVTELPDEGSWVRVKWDCGGENKYRLGCGGCYDVELADV
ncbi:E3 ubiquitin-protein ligase TRIM56-like [Glandiceps talaboti]